MCDTDGMTKTKPPAIVCAAPCAKCPFRSRFRGDDDYLRPGRREGIIRSLLEGADFPCHETTVETDEDEEGFTDMAATGDSSSCAGAWLVMLRADRAPQMARIAERLGSVDLEALLARNADVELWSYEELTGFGDDADDEFEPCEVVDEGCLAPAGYMIGGEVVRGEVGADSECTGCGRPVCSNCLDDAELCPTCAEYQ